jgi:prevent-host-death family protein
MGVWRFGPFPCHRGRMEAAYSLAHAQACLDDVVDEVCLRRRAVRITRRGKPVVAIVPIEMLNQWLTAERERNAATTASR